MELNYNQLFGEDKSFSCDKETLPFYLKSCPPDGAMINFKGSVYTFVRLSEISYDPCYLYMFYRLYEVDHIYRYFVKDSKFIPLKRNKSWTRFIFPWLIIGKYHHIMTEALEFEWFEFDSLDSLSEFFATLLKLED